MVHQRICNSLNCETKIGNVASTWVRQQLWSEGGLRVLMFQKRNMSELVEVSVLISVLYFVLFLIKGAAKSTKSQTRIII